jgi:hypothetical protein
MFSAAHAAEDVKMNLAIVVPFDELPEQRLLIVQAPFVLVFGTDTADDRDMECCSPPR